MNTRNRIDAGHPRNADRLAGLRGLLSLTAAGTHGRPYQERRQILLANRLSLLSIAITTPYQAFYLWYDIAYYWPVFLANILFIGSYASVPFLNRRGFLVSARYIVLGTVYVQLFVVTAFLGAGAGVHLFYLPTEALLLLLFVNSNSLVVLLMMVVTLALFLACHFAFPIGSALLALPDAVEPVIYAASVMGTIFLGGGLLLLAQREISRAENGLVRANRELDDRRREVEHANRAKSRFLAAASHDIRQPLHALNLFTGSLAAGNHAPGERLILDRMQESLDSVRLMFNGLLDISRLDAGAVTPRLQALSVQSVFDRLRTTFAESARVRGTTLDIRATPARVISDDALLERLLGNLIHNALQYAEGGYVLVVARRRDGQWRMEVRDNGPGIAPELHESVFEEFERGDSRQSEAAPGFGLGLSIVRRMAGLLEHPLVLRSAPGCGTTMAIHAEPAGEAGEAHASHSPSRIDEVRILVIGRDRDMREAAARVLGAAGAVVTTLSRQRESWSPAFKDARAQVIVIDGVARTIEEDLEFYAEITALAGATGTPVILLSGAAALTDVWGAAESNITVLHKPVNRDMLIRTVGSLLPGDEGVTVVEPGRMPGDRRDGDDR